MKRIPITAVAVLLGSLFFASGAWAFGTKDVIQMHRDGIADSLIIQKIEHSGKNFDLNARDMRNLKEAGVSDEVVSAMLATEDQDRGDYGYRAYPYPYYYYPYYYPRAFLGLGLGFYGHYGYYGRSGYYGHYGRYGYYGRPGYYGHYTPHPIGNFAPLRHGFPRSAGTPSRAPARAPSMRRR